MKYLSRLGTVINWILVGLFVVMALGTFLSQNYLPGFIFLILAYIISPYSNALLNRWNASLSKAGIKTGIVILALILMAVIGALTTTAADKPTEAIDSENLVGTTSAETLEEPNPVVTSTVADTPVKEVPSEYKVLSVVDGDTIKVSIDGKSETLRLIGINTPETVDPRKPVECFGQEASDKAKAILTNQYVRLQADPSQGKRDKYDRLLMYVFLSDGTNFNQMMIEQGYAYEYTYNLPYKYQTSFKAAQKWAQENKKGLWAPNVCQPATTTSTVAAPTPTTSTYVAPTKPSVSSGGDKNCSDFSTHAEAQAYFESKGGSASYNADGLDRDKDGEACETLP